MKAQLTSKKNNMIRKVLITAVVSVAISLQAFGQGTTAQTISFPQVTGKTVSSAPFNLTAVAQSNDPVTYTLISGGGVASLLGNTVTLAGDSAGNVTIEASQSGDINFAAAPNVYMTFSVAKNTNTVTLASIPLQYASSTTYNTLASSLYGTIAYTSSNTAVATIDASSGVITILGPGTSVIKASVPVSSTALAGSASQTLTIDKAPNAVTLPSIGTKYLITTPFTVTATSAAGVLGGAITYTSSNTTVATINPVSGLIIIAGTGVTNITATAAATADYNSGSATQALSVTKSTNTVTLPAISSVYTNATPFTVTATSAAGVLGGAITYASSNPAVATINSTSGLITVVAAGTTKITATAAASTDYNAALATQSFTVNKLLTNTITLPVIAPKLVTAAGFTVTATSSAGAAAGSITYTSSVPAVATVDPITGAVTILTAGSTVITASTAINATYAAASAHQTLTVTKNTTVVTLAAIPAKLANSAAFSVSASSNFGSGTITYVSSNPAVASVSGAGLVTILTAGTTYISASVAATADYTAGSAQKLLSVAKNTTVVTLASIPTKLANSAPFTVSATTNFGTITYSSSDTNVATINSSGQVTIVGAGISSIKASVATSSTYSAGSATQTLNIGKLTQTITWGGSTGAELTTASPFTVTATASSGLTTTITVASGPATISAGVVTLTTVAGTVVLKATQTGNSTYNALTSTINIDVAAALTMISGTESGKNGTVKAKGVYSNTTITESDITIYPNPAHGTVNIEVPETVQSLDVYSITGQQVLHNSTVLSGPINVSNLPKGVYFVRFMFNDANNPVVKKLVVE